MTLAQGRPVRVARILLFLALTFGISWGVEFWELSLERRGTSYGLTLPPLGMVVPAFVAIALRLFAFRDSPIHVSRYRQRPRWILIGFLVLGLGHGTIVLLAANGIGPASFLKIAGSNLTILWALSVFYIYRRSSEADVKRGGLWIGDNGVSLKFLVAIVLFLLLQGLLDLVFGLGHFTPRAETLYGIVVPGRLYVPSLVLAFGFFAVIAMPLGALAITFGEEYGWRGFLQDELAGIGLRRSALLIGLIWGTWHIPILLSGVHTYPPTAAGFATSLVFFSLWGVVQTYVVLKSGGIWAAAFLHGLVNSVYGFMRVYFVKPDDKIMSFGLGVFGVASLLLVVVAIWQDPVWVRHLRPAGASGPPADHDLSRLHADRLPNAPPSLTTQPDSVHDSSVA